MKEWGLHLSTDNPVDTVSVAFPSTPHKTPKLPIGHSGHPLKPILPKLIIKPGKLCHTKIKEESLEIQVLFYFTISESVQDVIICRLHIRVPLSFNDGNQSRCNSRGRMLYINRLHVHIFYIL